MLRRAIVLALCGVLLACDAAQPTEPTLNSSTVTLTGRVLDAATGAPLEGANIYILQGQNSGRFAMSDGSGAFTLADLRSGTFLIEVVKARYVAAKGELTLSANHAMDFRLAPFVPERFALRGRITDINTGTPLAGATVTILDGPDASREATTDAAGAFQIPDVTFGGFTLRARRDGYDSVFQDVRLTGDTFLDVPMRPARESLAGPWTGDVSYSTGDRTLLALTMTHSAAAIAGTGSGQGVTVMFSATLENPSSIGSTTNISGHLTLRSAGGGRNSVPCDGTGEFRGTINWTQMAATAPRVTYSCGGEKSVVLSLTREH